ncbi:unnamed protein product [Arabis nemorensis]|uniref:Uncharacterized protein n=1 Tax=Arabis nemorensis TaxID=586526 RepID=A0A565CT54_9BRAS|nr:unnamed protein product [Arabis nemorensis]
MGKVVRLVRGSWRKNAEGEWNLELIPTEVSYGVMALANRTRGSTFGAVSNVLPDDDIHHHGNSPFPNPTNFKRAKSCRGIDDTLVFWQGLLGKCYIHASESVFNEIFNSDEVAMVRVSTPAVPTMVLEAPPNPISPDFDDCDGSSTGSSNDIGILDGCEIMPRNNVVLLDEDLDILEESVRFNTPTPRPVTGGSINIFA